MNQLNTLFTSFKLVSTNRDEIVFWSECETSVPMHSNTNHSWSWQSGELPFLMLNAVEEQADEELNIDFDSINSIDSSLCRLDREQFNVTHRTMKAVGWRTCDTNAKYLFLAPHSYAEAHDKQTGYARRSFCWNAFALHTIIAQLYIFSSSEQMFYTWRKWSHIADWQLSDHVTWPVQSTLHTVIQTFIIPTQA